MPVIGAAFLLTVSWTFARIHVEYDGLRPPPPIPLVDPPTGQIGECDKVLGPAQPLRLEAPHLAGRSGRPADRPIANYPTHRRITTQPFGVVHVFVPGQPPEYRLAQQPSQPMT